MIYSEFFLPLDSDTEGKNVKSNLPRDLALDMYCTVYIIGKPSFKKKKNIVKFHNRSGLLPPPPPFWPKLWKILKNIN